MNLDESLAADDELADLEWEGHVVGDVWQVRLKGRVFLDREINTIMGDELAGQTQRDCFPSLRNH